MEKPKSPKTQNKKRWYDQHSGLAEALDTLRSASKADRDNMLEKMKEILTQEDPHFIDKHCDKFTLNPYKRRWYDKDPYLWLIINSLRYTDETTISRIVSSINKRS